MNYLFHLYYNFTKLDTCYVLINKRSKNNTPNYLLEEPNFLQFSGKQRKEKEKRQVRERAIRLCTVLSLNICGHNYHKVDNCLSFPLDVLIALLQKYKVCITELFYL